MTTENEALLTLNAFMNGICGCMPKLSQPGEGEIERRGGSSVVLVLWSHVDGVPTFRQPLTLALASDGSVTCDLVPGRFAPTDGKRFGEAVCAALKPLVVRWGGQPAPASRA